MIYLSQVSGSLLATNRGLYGFPWIIADSPALTKKSFETDEDLLPYLLDAYVVFQQESQKLTNTSSEFTKKDEERLLFMLKSLIDGRKIFNKNTQ